MLSRNVGATVIAHEYKTLSKEEQERYAASFAQGDVRVFYSCEEGKITYFAYLDEEYGMVCFHADGTYRIGTSPLSKALAHHVYEIDRRPEDALRALYGDDFESLRRYVELGPAKCKAYAQLTNRVDELAAKIVLTKKMGEKKSPRLRFVIDSSRALARVSVRVGFDKLYLNRRTAEFAHDYFAGKMQKVQKEYVTLERGCFSPNVEKALQYLANISWKSGVDYGFLFLSAEPMVEFLSLLPGETIEWNENYVTVAPLANVELSMDGDGKLIVKPDIGAVKLIREGAYAYRLNGSLIELYRFASPSAGDVYEFFQASKGIDSGMLAEAMAKRVLPLLTHGELRLESGFLEKHPVIRPEIHYYIGLEQDSSLTFHTEYRLGDQVVDEMTFRGYSPMNSSTSADFREALSALDLPVDGKKEGDDAVFLFLRLDLSALDRLCQIYVSEELQKRKVSSVPNMNLNISSGEDWFSMELSSEGFTQEDLIRLYNAYSRKKKYVRLKNTYVALDENDGQLKRLQESFSASDFGVELPLYQALKLPFVSEENDAKILDLIRKVEDYEQIKLDSLSPAIEEHARPYQRQGIRFLLNLYRLQLSGILSDDMGLGKTLQAFGLFSSIREEKPLLVVCPKSLIYNWMEERDKWAPDLPAYVLVGNPKERRGTYAKMAKGKKAVYFISYDTLRNDVADIEGIQFGLVVLDEGQYIANAQAQKTHAVKKLKADCRIVLTGTPVQNSLIDLWSIFDFLLPGYFPPLMQFKELYGALTLSSDEARSRLLAKIKPFLLGRKKKDVLSELPDKENIVLSLAMNDDQRQVYLSYVTRAREMLEEGERINLLAMMTRLRQTCISPALFLEGEFQSAKLDWLIQALLDLKAAGRKAIVFSSFVGALEEIKRRCKEAGLVPEEITGETSARVRVVLAGRFNAPDSTIDVMLVSLKAGGTGLNLIGADTVFHLDPWWNLAAERQAEDRAHRIGQTNKVTVFKLVIKGTIEERVLSLQEKKGMLIDLTDEASLSTSLTDDDYRYLLS